MVYFQTCIVQRPGCWRKYAAAASSSGKSPHAAFMMIFGPKRMPQQSSKRLSPLDQLSPRGAHGLGSSAGSHAPEGPHVAPGADAEKGAPPVYVDVWESYLEPA